MVWIAIFHYYEDFTEFLRIIDYIIVNYYGIVMGKYIILHDQISTKTSDVISKKNEDNYLFNTIFREESKFKKFCDDGIIKENNFIDFENIPDDEFDEFDNLKKATTLDSYEDLVKYMKKHNLGEV